MHRTHRSDPPWLVFSGAAAAVSWLPVPILDDVALAAVRRTAFRHVARRHGVSVAPPALRVLGEPLGEPSGAPLLLARWLAARWLLPLRWALRFKDALALALELHLFDHYLSTLRPPDAEALIGEHEARRVREAMQRAVGRGWWEGPLEGFGELPRGLREAGRGLVRGDERGEMPRLEAAIDALLRHWAQAEQKVRSAPIERFRRALRIPGASPHP